MENNNEGRDNRFINGGTPDLLPFEET